MGCEAQDRHATHHRFISSRPCHPQHHQGFVNITNFRKYLLTRSQFIAARGNEYFCEIDEDYLTDRFNLTGLNTEVQYYQYALDLVTDVFDMEVDDDMREQIEKSARHLYGLVHARYVVTTRGLAKMVSSHTTQQLLTRKLTNRPPDGKVQARRLR